MTGDADLDGQDAATIALAERGRLVAQVACYDTTT